MYIFTSLSRYYSIDEFLVAHIYRFFLSVRLVSRIFLEFFYNFLGTNIKIHISLSSN